MNNETQQNENTKQSKKPTHTVCSVKEINGKEYWNTHGVAFEHVSGQGLSVILKNTDKK